METCIKEIGSMIKLKVLENTYILMEQHMKVNGKTIFNMEMEWNSGMMEIDIKENIRMV